MTAEEVKSEISQRTGIPVNLLTGETPEEDIARAKALLVFKRQNKHEEPKSNNKLFAEWFRAQQGEEPDQDSNMEALKAYEEELRILGGGYPRLTDGGENIDYAGQDGRSAREAFADWMGQKAAFDPRKHNGWTTL